MAIYETHQDDSISDTLLNIQCYHIFRQDRDKNCGGTHLYIPAKVRKGL